MWDQAKKLWCLTLGSVVNHSHIVIDFGSLQSQTYVHWLGICLWLVPDIALVHPKMYAYAIHIMLFIYENVKDFKLHTHSQIGIWQNWYSIIIK